MDAPNRYYKIFQKRKKSPEATDPQPKKSRLDDADTASITEKLSSLRGLLDFTSLQSTSAISERFDLVANALLHDFRLVLQCGPKETEFEILELEFYLLMSEYHEDPFTHGAEEQRFSAKWYFHRAPRRSVDSHRSLTSSTEYRGGSRKGMDLTIGGPAIVTSPHPDSNSTKQLLRGGALLRSARRVSDHKVISGPSLLVDQILLLSKAESIPDLVQDKWANDISAIPSVTDNPRSVSLYLKPASVPSSSKPKPIVYCSPRIGLDLSHPGTTTSPNHPRVNFISRPYRYFTNPRLLTANGRTQTFLGVLRACLDSGRYGNSLTNAALRRELVKLTSLKEQTVIKYTTDYQAGLDGGDLKAFVGPAGKGASGSPATYLRMMGTLERLRNEASATIQTS